MRSSIPRALRTILGLASVCLVGALLLYRPKTPTHVPRGCSDVGLTTLQPRENAAIVILSREKDAPELAETLLNFESFFNAHFRYPYVIISSPDEGPFSSSFRSTVQASLPQNAIVEYDTVPSQNWSIPAWMDKQSVRSGFLRQEKENVQYAGREGYHHMCRFYSAPFAHTRTLKKYNWFWRLEPGVRYYCKMTYDPFLFLKLRDKIYGFVVSIVETPNTIPSLLPHVNEFIRSKNLNPGDLWPFLTENAYSLCHFWTNFEIGNLDFFRSKSYDEYFAFLDAKGGFYSERWGDAPVRSLGLGIFSNKSQVHFFDDIAYKHDYFMHCPHDRRVGCECDCPSYSKDAVDIDKDIWYSCLDRFLAIKT